MHSLSVRDTLMFGWTTFSKRPWFFITLFVCLMIAYAFLSFVTDPAHQDHGPMAFALFVASVVLGTVLEIMLVNIALKSHSNVEAVTFSDAYVRLPFWSYLGTKVLVALIVVLGLILVIVPGVIAGLALMFATYLIVDKGRTPLEAIKESVRMTKGNRWKLFLFVLALAALNIVGAVLFFVGLMVTVPVTYLAMVHAYRTLDRASEKASA